MLMLNTINNSVSKECGTLTKTRNNSEQSVYELVTGEGFSSCKRKINHVKIHRQAVDKEGYSGIQTKFMHPARGTMSQRTTRAL